jgi:hypothetical protein
VHLPVTARDLAWLLSVIRRINSASARKRRQSAMERVASLAVTWRGYGTASGRRDDSSVSPLASGRSGPGNGEI